MDRKFFDISSPNRVTTPATSRPIIIGHRPIMTDPMVRPQPAAAPAYPSHTPMTVQVSDGIRSDLAQAQSQGSATAPQPPPAAPQPPQPIPSPVVRPPAPAEPPTPQPAPLTPDTAPQNSPAVEPETTAQAVEPSSVAATPAATPAQEADLSHLPHMPIAHARHKNGRLRYIMLWGLIIIFLAVLAGFLAIDAGLVGNASKLPFHIFSQD